jgi:hypothetical protein
MATLGQYEASLMKNSQHPSSELVRMPTRPMLTSLHQPVESYIGVAVEFKKGFS